MMPETRHSSFREQLRPFADALAAVEQLICTHVETMPDADLKRLRAATSKPTETNCSYLIYEVAPLVRDHANREIHRRKHARAGVTRNGGAPR
jgi:hypothetical protein